MPDLERARAYNSRRLNDIAAVEAGALETNSQLLSGFPFSFVSAQRSCQLWIAATIDDLQGRPFFDDSKLIAALNSLHTRFDTIRLQRVIKAAEASSLHEITERGLIYLAFKEGQMSTRMRLAAMCLAGIRSSSLSAPFYLATALGLSCATQPESMAECRTVGFKKLAEIEKTEAELRTASKPEEPTSSDLDEDEHEAFLQAVAEDRAEFFGAGTPDSPLRFRKKQQRPGAVVLAGYELPPATGRDDRQRSKRDMLSIAGKRLPFTLTGDVADHMDALCARAPHLEALFSELLLDTCMSQHVRIRPWLFVGDPGAGKTWAAREFAEVLGLPISVYDAGSSHDASFGGTPAQWSSTGVCEPLRLVAASGVANPLLVVDEIDKAANSPHNGSIHNSLLAFLDLGSAAKFHDPSIEMKVDLSHVNFILTANELGRVPAPLRDRCRIVQVPNPGPEHVGVLVRRIVDDLARKRGIDPRWTPPFDADEIENITAAWGSGSIRKLRQVTIAALDFRSRNMGSC